MVQTLVVTVIVVACAVYAAWTLMPASLRRRVAVALLARPLPEAVARRLRPHAVASSGCGCDGCDHAPAKAKTGAMAGTPSAAATPAVQPLRFYPRPPR
jgi:hypothetical protein